MSKILHKAAASLELPADIIGGAARISLLGQDKVKIGNHRGIIHYGKDQIVLRLAHCRLKICGAGLNLSELNDEQVKIEGHITKLLFEEERTVEAKREGFSPDDAKD